MKKWLSGLIRRLPVIRQMKNQTRQQSRHQAARSFHLVTPIPPVPDPTIPCAPEDKELDDLTKQLDILLAKIRIAAANSAACHQLNSDDKTSIDAAFTLMGSLSQFVRRVSRGKSIK